MAENNNYIGVAMGLDVTDLKAGLSEANKQIQLANSEFKAASSGMDDWTKSTDGLNAKVTQLTSVLDLQKKKLSGLQAEYDNLDKSSATYEEQARKLKVQINNQQSVVNKTEKELSNYSQTLKDAEAGNIDLTEVTLKNGKALEKQSQAAEEAEKSTSKFGDVAKGVAGVVVGLGAAVVGAVGGFLSLAESTRETRTQLGQLETAFETAGFSSEVARESVEGLTGVLGDQQQATETAQQLAALAKSEEDLTEYTNILTGVYAKFGESLKVEGLAESINHTIQMSEVNGNLADALEWSGVNVDDFNVKLASLSTEEERSALIQSTLNGLYGESAEKYKEVNADVIAAQEAQSKLNNAMADLGAIAEPIMTSIKLLAVDLLNSIKPFVELIGDGLTGVLNGTLGATKTLAEGLNGLLNVLLEKITTTIPMILSVVLELLPMLTTTLLGMLPSLVTTITSLVTQIIQTIAELLPSIVKSIMEVLPLIINSLVNSIPLLLDAAIQLLMAIVDSIPVIVKELTKSLPKVIETILNALIKSIPIILDGAIKLLNAVIDAIPIIIKALVPALPKIINTIVNGLVEAWPMVLTAAMTLLMAVVNAIPQIVQALIPAIPQIITTITKVLTNNMPVILKTSVQLFTQIVKAIPQIVSELFKNIPQIIKAIVDGLVDGWPDIKEAGLDLVKGIWDGIKGGANWLKSKVEGFAGDVSGWFKKTFKIGSPSKLMADEVGIFIGEGIGEGIIDSLPYVKKDLSKFSNFVSDNLGGIKGGLSVGNGGGSSVVVNAGMNVTYNGSLSRKQLKQLEQDNYNSIKMKLKLEGAI